MDCSTPGFPVLHHLPEFTQVHVHWTIQPSQSLPPPFLPSIFLSIRSFPMSQLFPSNGQSIEASVSASILPMNIQDWFPLGLTGFISLPSKGLSRVFPSTTIGKHQFFDIQPSLWSSSHIRPWLLKWPELWLYAPLLAKWCLCFSIHCLGWS